MKNKPVLSMGNRAVEILKYISKNDVVKSGEIYEEFNLNGNGIFIKQLNEKGLIEKIDRGRYKISEVGIKLLTVLEELK